MKYMIKFLFTFFFSFYILIGNAQYITVNDNYTAQQLVENILVNSNCASVLNPASTGDTFTSGHNSYAYFNSGISNFPFKEGVLLCTGNSIASTGPFTSGQRGGGNKSWLGDADLDQALGIQSVNATVLEFDFTPMTNFISFDYIFASNEYQSYFPCAFSDGFAFLIKEKGSAEPYKNLAVLPNSNTPVSSQNVHPKISSGINSQGQTINGCLPINESYFNGFNTNSSPINYAGQTVVMKAQTNVTALKTYHIKLVIADDKEEYFDSVVFLQAGSFKSNIDLGPDKTLTSSSPVCNGQSLVIDTKLPSSYSYKWYKNGTLLPSAINPSYTVTDNGTYKVHVLLSPSTCTANDEIKVEFDSEIKLNNATLIQCDDNGDFKTSFNLTKVDALIKNNDSTLESVVYYETLSEAKNQINPINNPTNYTNTSVNQTVYARVTNKYDCSNFAELNLQISNNIIASQNSIAICDEDSKQDGLYLFDLNTQVTPQILNGLPSVLTVEYYLNYTDAISQNNTLLNIFKNTIPNEQIVYARVINGPDCYGIIPITLIVNTFSPSNFQEEKAILCKDSKINLAVDNNFSSYLWNTGNTNNYIEINKPGNYSVQVTDANGCNAVKKFNVLNSEIATITDVEVNDFSGNMNSVLIKYTGVGDYEFSLDGISFQDNPQFNGIPAGTYLASARDKNNCGLSISFQVYVLDYPPYFTPNGDGYNDIWKINNLDLFPKSVITIFDRYGKLLEKINSTNTGWNGTLNGNKLPADDYWFNIIFDGNRRIIKGHFSLKR